MDEDLDPQLMQEAAELAAAWQRRANELRTAAEQSMHRRLGRLLDHQRDKVILLKLLDQGFRSGNRRRVFDQLRHTACMYGVPQFLAPWERAALRGCLGLGRFAPALTVAGILQALRRMSRRVVLDADPSVLHRHLQRRRAEGVRMNINHLGEALQGEGEAKRRMASYEADLRNPQIECVSLKISTIYSQIHPLACDATVEILSDRLASLLKTAHANRFVRPDGSSVPKRIHLDMEEARDVDITIAAFKGALDRDDLLSASAGIALQAYLPDSFDQQRALTAWAHRRVARGGAPVFLRLVKGANLEMEKTNASLRCWPIATYDRKLDVDANYKCMVRFALEPRHIEAVRPGIASHNLFDLAFAFRLASRLGVTRFVTFEMLEGMADPVRRAVQETSADLLVYAPVASREGFLHAIAYLVRRLDENTAADNFLRYAPRLSPDSDAWRRLRHAFYASCRRIPHLDHRPRRTQDRSQSPSEPGRPTAPGAVDRTTPFTNEPDTDWSLAANRAWAESIRAQWRKHPGDAPLTIPLVVGGRELVGDRPVDTYLDPNPLPAEVCIARTALAQDEDVEQAVAVARRDPDGWRSAMPADRHRVLARVAMELRQARGDLIGIATANTGKVFSEADSEVSEAIDFVEFYPRSVSAFEERADLRIQGRGVGLVLSPWNFPIAIPCGGLAASLAAGNTVILKPAPESVPVAWILCECFWRAGISRSALQFVPCREGPVLDRLTHHPDIDYVILTGGTETGLTILRRSPDLRLAAETGGKNATIVTSMADRDQAIQHVLHSAFSHGGQKCSATSLLILEKEVYEDANFEATLVDAARSLRVGSAWDFATVIGPLIRPPSGVLHRALTQLDPGERWALPPAGRSDHPLLWSPGIKYGVQPGSLSHHTEFFGPVLSVLRADNLPHAIDLVNATGYGLTSALESLDPREHALWADKVVAGNLYINKGTTGAIVLRQPFGGMRKSALGAGIKAGGPNYAAQFMRIEAAGDGPVESGPAQDRWTSLIQAWSAPQPHGSDRGRQDQLRRTAQALSSYRYWHQREFSRERDYVRLRGQDNVVRYLPAGTIAIRIHPDDSLFDILARIAAARMGGCTVQISICPDVDPSVMEFLGRGNGRELMGNARVASESDEALIAAMPHLDRIRYAAPERVPRGVLEAAAQIGLYIARDPVSRHGRIELMHVVREQSICTNVHRYGNLGERAEQD